jgi:ribonuclease R
MIAGAARTVFLSQHIGELFDGIVTDVKANGTFVRTLNLPVEGRLVRGAQELFVGDQVAMCLVATDPDIEFSRVSRHDR